MIGTKEKSEKAANDFDLELFNLMARAANLGEDHGSSPRRAIWKQVRVALETIRPKVRAMMSEEDRKRTS